jgi:hypothetical protein
MALTYELIQNITGSGNPYVVPSSGNVANVTFSGIPSTYTDLMVYVSARSSSASAEGTYISFNGSTSDFIGTYLISQGDTAGGTGNIPRYIGSVWGGGNTNAFNATKIYISGYTTNQSKTFVLVNAAEMNAGFAYVNMIGGLWANSSVINSITISCTGFTQNSSFSLYGIKKA